jgi:hypothetical protein
MIDPNTIPPYSPFIKPLTLTTSSRTPSLLFALNLVRTRQWSLPSSVIGGPFLFGELFDDHPKRYLSVLSFDPALKLQGAQPDAVSVYSPLT